MDSITLLCIYCGPKIIGSLAAKFGVVPVANLFSSIAPSVMSFTFFATTAHHFPKFSSLCLLPQLGLSALVFFSVGLNGFTLKNLIFPSVAAIIGYQGWLMNSPFLSAAFQFDHVSSAIKHASMVTAIALILLHVLYIARAFAVRIVYPAPIIAQVINVKQLREQAIAVNGATRQRIPSSQTPGAFLDALLFTTPNAQVHSADRFPHAWLIYLGGNGELAETSFDSARELGNSLGCKVAVFNPRGVGDSGGFPVASSDELVADAVDVVRHIVEKYGARQEHIILFGHSIGGGVAAELATKHFPRVSLVLDRTFSNLPDAARAMMPIFPPPLVKFLLPKFFGEFPNDENWDKITEHDRKVVSFHAQDQIIKYDLASLARHARFGRGGSDENRVIELVGRVSDPHNVPVSPQFFPAGSAALTKRMADFLKQTPA